MQKKEGSAYQRWYEKNKEKLAEKRRKRYKEDPVYRQKALAARKAQIANTPKVRDSLPKQYVYTVSSLSEKLKVSDWKVREWKRKGYFPEPFKHGREIWFNKNQTLLLIKLRDFLDSRSNRVPEDDPELLSLVDFIFVNW